MDGPNSPAGTISPLNPSSSNPLPTTPPAVAIPGRPLPGQPLTAGRATITDLLPPAPSSNTSSSAESTRRTLGSSSNAFPAVTTPTPTVTRAFIPPGAPVGSIVFTRPTQGVVSYYKIAPSETITFGWNFANVIVSPTSLTLRAGCDNGYTYPVGPSDGILPGNTTQVMWDVYNYQAVNRDKPLAQAQCTLTIHDDRGFNGMRRPGWLEPNTALAFAMYTSGSYIPLSEGWTCAGCSGAVGTSAVSHPILASLVVSALVMVLSGAHLLRAWGMNAERR